MSKMKASGEELSECGSGILPGFRRFLETMWVLVVKTSHIGSVPSGVGEDEEEAARRDFLSEEAAADTALFLM